MAARNINAEDVRRAIDAPSGAVSSWLYGDKLPTIHYAAKLETIFGVLTAWWTLPPAETFVPPGAREAQS